VFGGGEEKLASMREIRDLGTSVDVRIRHRRDTCSLVCFQLNGEDLPKLHALKLTEDTTYQTLGRGCIENKRHR